MRFPPVEDIPDIEKQSFNINRLDQQMNELMRDVRFAVTHNFELHRRSPELVSSLDDLLSQHSYTHQSMRLLLRHAYRNKDYPIVADSASLAREQVEKIYQAVLLIQGPHKWIRQYLRNAWQKNYEEYLLELDEHRASKRLHEHLHKNYPQYLENGRKVKLKPQDSILVSDFAIKVIEYEWHHRKSAKPLTKPAWFTCRSATRRNSISGYLKKYFYFPTPWDVMTKIRNKQLFLFLDRWYREYKELSEYSHVLIGKIAAQRMARFKGTEFTAKNEIYGKKKAESWILISSIAAASLCAVILPHVGNDYGSTRTTKEYWEKLYNFSLLAKALWKLYPEKVLR